MRAGNWRQHYLPAAFLARFSVDPNPDLRRRVIVVGQRNPFAIFESAAEGVGFVRGLYEYGLGDIWRAYEERLPAALDEISRTEATEIDGEIWLRVLVPFVAGLLLRGPDFEEPLAHPPVVPDLILDL